METPIIRIYYQFLLEDLPPTTQINNNADIKLLQYDYA